MRQFDSAVEIREGLLVTPCGRVFKEARYLKRGTTYKQYSYISHKGERLDVHRLVALSYLPNPTDLPWVLHSDDIETNNHVSNLKWGTPQNNSDDAKVTRLTLRSQLKKNQTEQLIKSLLVAKVPVEKIRKRLKIPIPDRLIRKLQKEIDNI